MELVPGVMFLSFSLRDVPPLLPVLTYCPTLPRTAGDRLRRALPGRGKTRQGRSLQQGRTPPDACLNSLDLPQPHPAVAEAAGKPPAAPALLPVRSLEEDEASGRPNSRACFCMAVRPRWPMHVGPISWPLVVFLYFPPSPTWQTPWAGPFSFPHGPEELSRPF
jgi:hypothetical protein